VADTGSDSRRRSVRLTLRLRLTLLYGGIFIAAGAGLLAVTYGLFKHSQGTQNRSVLIRGVQFAVPQHTVLSILAAGRAAGQVHAAPVKGKAGPVINQGRAIGGSTAALPAGTGLPKSLLKRIQRSGQTQLLALARRANLSLRTQQAGDASALLEWSGIALAAVALLSIGLAWWLAGRALRPLRLMNTRAREISAENLHERLGVEGRSDELGQLATTFDALLTRLESSFDAQRRFVANASHELRTPITLERTLAEVALADPNASVESLRRVCERVVISTEQQERLLDALLTLARSEAGVAAGQTVDLAVLIDEALLAREARLEGIAVERELEPAVVVGDQALLERLVANLLDNSIVHNGGDGHWISVATGEFGGASGLRIANSSEVIEPDGVTQLFEPFRRGAGERVGGGDGGLGLGLSIVRAVAVAHAAEIESRTLPGGGLEFELRFSSEVPGKPPVGGFEIVTN
jgi:signal transduction histidine kinase